MKKITLKPRGKDNNFSRIGTGLSIQDGVLSAEGGVLIVEGTYNSGFTANAGQPNWNDAKDAFLAGRNVILVFSYQDELYKVSIHEYSEDINGSELLKFTFGNTVGEW